MEKAGNLTGAPSLFFKGRPGKLDVPPHVIMNFVSLLASAWLLWVLLHKRKQMRMPGQFTARWLYIQLAHLAAADLVFHFGNFMEHLVARFAMRNEGEMSYNVCLTIVTFRYVGLFTSTTVELFIAIAFMARVFRSTGRHVDSFLRWTGSAWFFGSCFAVIEHTEHMKNFLPGKDLTGENDALCRIGDDVVIVAFVIFSACFCVLAYAFVFVVCCVFGSQKAFKSGRRFIMFYPANFLLTGLPIIFWHYSMLPASAGTFVITLMQSTSLINCLTYGMQLRNSCGLCECCRNPFLRRSETAGSSSSDEPRGKLASRSKIDCEPLE
eukprot:TRINITY_DN55387_c0_g1_i1.p1 TRINITY_DN55387_c0_g1~~TRINITY_DN55387_c0_g1_i1.p1  ORF type:complete len:324 (-),score=22.52 TRINITY_DN55387_c0_g1_i1:99-1070(-)